MHLANFLWGNSRPTLLKERKGAVIGFVVAVLAVGALRFALSLSGVPDQFATFSSMTAVIVIGVLYFGITCSKPSDRLLAAYVLYLPYTLVDAVALGYTWWTGYATIFQRHEHAFGLTVGQHLGTMVVTGLTTGPLIGFFLMSAIGWIYWKTQVGKAEMTAAKVITVFCLVFALSGMAAQAPALKHINRAIELLEQGQPVYYTGSHSGTEGSFEQGKKDAQIYADYISYDMEHAPFDVKGLAEYMRGLVAGGPTKSGHRTPAVIVNVPVNGTDEATVRANAWMFHQVLATGVHGVLLTHADTPGAVRAFVEAIRLPIHKQGLDKGIKEGRRGVHGAPTAAQIWGVSQDEYLQKADAWPLNPNGELLLGLKLEDKYALANAEQNLEVPGIAFAEWGPGDMALSLGVRGSGAVAQKAPEMVAARARVFAACKANKLFFLNSFGANDVIDLIKEGVMIGPASQQTAEIGRKFTKRALPW